MELIVLGATGSWPDRGTALSGYLIQHEGFNLWVDAGSGTMANLQRYISIRDVHAMIITHEHADHCVDVYPLFYARYYGGMGPNGMPLYLPKGFGQRVLGLLSEESIAGFHEGFDVHEVSPGDAFELGPFHVSANAMSHLGLPALGFRIESNGSCLAYTGDTGPDPAAVDLARDADVFLSEATYQDADELQPFHLSARQAGEYAKAAGARKLVLTHLLPTHDRERSRQEAAEAYGGPVEVAVEGLRIEVGG